MKKMKRWLILALTLALVMSLSFAVSAEETGEEHAPYLSYWFLGNNGDGWFVEEYWDEEAARNNGYTDFTLTPFDEHYMIFYLNTWNEETQSYDAQPVQVTAEEHLALSLVKDNPEESFLPGQNVDYFYVVSALESGWDQTVQISYTMDDGTVLSVATHIQRNEAGFYSGPVMRNDNYINKYVLDPFADENVFYFGFQSGYWTLNSVEAEGATEQYSLERLDNGMYKITLDPYYASGNWGIDVALRLYLTDPEGNSNNGDWITGFWVEANWPEAKASIEIDGVWYSFYETDGGTIAAMEEPMDVWNEWGDQEWRLVETELPAGVSYDIASNTLTLNNASLERMYTSSWDLNNENLTINLIGSSTITCDHNSAVHMNNINATITGSGSLYIKAVNSADTVDENGYHYAFDAVEMHETSALTISGSAKITVEIAGIGYHAQWDGETYLGKERAFLSALRVNEGNITLKDNAVLTTVLPDDARGNGPMVSEEEAFWGNRTPGGYRGVENCNSLTVQDNATLNTTSIYISDGVDENGNTMIGSFNLYGGTVNIDGIPHVDEMDQWEWDEENQQDVYLGTIPHYHYEGINTYRGDINISGGKLNIRLNASAEALENSVYGYALSGELMDCNITGGSVNLTSNFGMMAMGVGSWDVESGEIGSLNITGGEVTADVTNDSGYATVEVRDTGILNISGGKVTLNEGQILIANKFVVSGNADVIINLSRIAEGDWAEAVGGYRGSDIEITGGSLTVNGRELNRALSADGTYTQTGGVVTLINESGEYGISSSGLVTISGGTLNVESPIGIEQWYDSGDPDNPDWPAQKNTKLTISGGTVNIEATMRGMQIIAPAEISGGNLNIDVSGIIREVTDYATGEVKEALYGVGMFVIGDPSRDISGNLNITGGTIVADVVVEENGYSAALCTVDGEVSITGGTLDLTGGHGIESAATVEDKLYTVIGDDMTVISANTGKALDFIHYEYNFDAEDEEGNPITVTEWDYWFEEDNTPGNIETNEGIDRSTHILVVSGKCGDDAWWEINDGVLTISGTGAMWEDCRPWTAVQSLIKEAVVEEGITYIGTMAFAELENLTSISYPATVEGFGSGVVAGSAKLESYAIAEGNGKYAVIDGIAIIDKSENKLKTVACAATGSFVIAEDVKSIAGGAFENSSLTEVTIPAGVESIGKGAFSGCKDLTVRIAHNSVGETYAKDNSLKYEYVHEYQDATCTEPSTCKYCDATHGTAPGHNYVNGICTVCGEKEPVINNPFDDVLEGQYYTDPVMWAVGNGITNGLSNNIFGVDENCTRGQFVTFLWRAAGSPEPNSAENPFTDVEGNQFYSKAVLWAVERGITTGLAPDKFGVNEPCTRAQVVTFLWRFAGKEQPTIAENPFEDALSGQFYSTAILWAVENGITTGLDNTTFGVNIPCNRAQVVTFLYRAVGDK